MTRRIYKFEIINQQPIYLPKTARLVFFCVQSGSFMIWVELNLKDECIARYFKIFGTGEDIEHNAVYLASLAHDDYIWHLYELMENNND